MAYTVIPTSGTAAAIVNLGATPPTRATAGQGGLTYDYTVRGTALVPINMPTTNFLPLVRIPTNAIIRNVKLGLDAAPSTSLTGSLGLTFSNVLDGTSVLNLSVYNGASSVPAIVSQSFFMFATAITAFIGGMTDVTFKNAAGNSVTDGFYVPSASLQPVWQALSLGGAGALGAATSGAAPSAFSTCQTDPYGFFDIVWFETTTGVNTGTAQLTCECNYSQLAA
jgi:hypothetical protein